MARTRIDPALFHDSQMISGDSKKLGALYAHVLPLATRETETALRAENVDAASEALAGEAAALLRQAFDDLTDADEHEFARRLSKALAEAPPAEPATEEVRRLATSLARVMVREWVAAIDQAIRRDGEVELNEFLLPEADKFLDLRRALKSSLGAFAVSKDSAPTIMRSLRASLFARAKHADLPHGIRLEARGGERGVHRIIARRP